jgi:hypothetical protein
MRIIKPTRNLLLLLPCAVLSACASNYAVPAGKSSAKVVFDLATGSTHATSRTFTVSAFDAFPSCKGSPYGMKLAVVLFSKNQELIGPVDVVAGEPLAFGVRYGDSVFGGNRDCSYVTAFTPEPGGLYVVSFRTRDEVSSCELTVQQQAPVAAGPIEISRPARSCFGSVADMWGDPLANGQGGGLAMKIHVTTQPPAK